MEDATTKISHDFCRHAFERNKLAHTPHALLKHVYVADAKTINNNMNGLENKSVQISADYNVLQRRKS